MRPRRLCLSFILLLICQIPLPAQQIISLTWNDVIGISRDRNLEIKIQNRDYAFQSKNVLKAYGEFLPRIDYQFQAVNNLERPEFVIPNFGRIRFGTEYNYTHLLQIQLPLFTGLSRIANLNIQSNLKKSMAEELRDKEDEVVLKALEAYFNLMLANTLIKVNQRGYDAAKANFDQVEKFYNLGGSSKLDYLRAKSRLASAQHLSVVQRFKHMYSLYQRNRDLISVGAYVGGTNPMLDEAIELYPRMEQFLKQNMFQNESYETSVAQLDALFAPAHQAA